MRKLARQRRLRHSKKTFNFKIPAVVLIALSFTSLLVCIFAYLANRSWDGQSRLSLAITRENGDTDIVILDPASHKLVRVLIPGNTMVRAANQMGDWPLSSIPQLAKNEGHTNDFLSQTITKTFFLPIENWAEKEALDLVGNNSILSFISVFKSFDTDLSFSDKLKIAWSAASIDSVDRYTVELADTSFLSETTLMDGTRGYKVGTSIPSSIAVLFADEEISEESARILLKNNTGTGSLSKELSQVVNVMGGKVFSIESGEKNEKDCEVWGTKVLTVAKISSVFNCAVTNKEASGYDVVIEVGEAFKKRY